MTVSNPRPLMPNMTTAQPRTAAPPVGWPLLPQPAKTGGRIVFRTLAESIHDHLEVVLQTARGEQLMHPGFGAGLQRFLHEPNSVQTRARIRDEITESLRRFEARITLDAVQVERGARPGEILADIRFHANHTGQPERIALTLTAGGG
jgi:uncharacterized protein